MKGHLGKIAHDQCGSLVLCSILSTIDDTKLTTKIIIRELQTVLKELILDKNGRVILQLLRPQCTHYFSPEDLVLLDASVPSLCSKEDFTVSLETDSLKLQETEKDTENKIEEEDKEDDTTKDADEKAISSEGGKKDPFLRRQELLVNSGLAESVINTCIESAGELLRSNFGKEVIYELVTGGSDGILQPSLNDKLMALNEAIASVAAEPKSEEADGEHVLENFHSSRTIRKMILDSPSFASTLWKGALQGSFKIWAKGHSAKVITAFLESSNQQVREMVRENLQPLLDDGTLKLTESK